MWRLLLLLGVLAGLPHHSSAVVDDAERYWAQWRGPYMTGVSKSAHPPTEWSETKNVKWKVEIPGRGSGSPVVWGNRLYLLTAVPVGVAGVAQHQPRGGMPQRGVHQYKVLAIDRATGKTVWERLAREEEPHEASHQDNGTWASSSAITDGTTVIAYFESRGLSINLGRGRERASLVFAVENLTDSFYREQFQFAPARGRSFTVGLNIGAF